MYTLAIRYSMDPRLSEKRQAAVLGAYAQLSVTARYFAPSRSQAREVAKACRELIEAFGIRRERRIEVPIAHDREAC